MSKDLALLMVWLVLPISGMALAQYPPDKLQRLDANHNGVVDKTEFSAGIKASFIEMDVSRDGVLTLDELVAYYTSTGLAGKISPRQAAQAQLTAMDQNRDGTITPDEFASSAEQSFAAFDKNHDGQLSAQDEVPTR